MEVVVSGGRWGTWEELLLGGAVLRHGTRDWHVVASELQTRTGSPYAFTPQICKVKYEDLLKRFSGRTAWFEELRKKRMAELRQALEVSEGSIGSLESKLQTLKAERGDDCLITHDSSHTRSLEPSQKSDGAETSSKEASKDGLSAGSYTQETRTNWSSECQNTEPPTEEIETKPEVSLFPAQDNISSAWKLGDTGQGGTVRRRRGKRKRKDCSKDVKEGSIGESEILGSFTARCKENSTSSSGQNAGCFGVDNQLISVSKDETTHIRMIFESIAENKCASFFRHRLDSQKRGRYKKMILQHMDFDTIRSRIGNQTITSTKEVFRDLLLLANNALVFYSKTTREYKSARLLREIVTKSLREHLKDYISRSTIALLSSTLPTNASVKPRSVRPGKSKLSGEVVVAKPVNTITSAPTPAPTTPTPSPTADKRSGNAHSPPLAVSLAITKKGSGRPRKTGRGGGSAPRRVETPAKGRKRVRAK